MDIKEPRPSSKASTPELPFDAPSSGYHKRRSTVRLNMLLKGVPIVAIVLYSTGYFIRLAYLRSVNVNCVDFLQGECFETGATFYVFSFAVLGFALFPLMIIHARRIGHDLIPARMTSVGFMFSVGSVLVLWMTYLTTAIFLRPQDIGTVHKHMGEMTIVAAIFALILIASTRLQAKWAQASEKKQEWLSNSADLIRIVLFIMISYYAYLIFVVDLSEPIYVFRDQYCLVYLLFLTLFALIAYRVFTNLLGDMQAAQQTSATMRENSRSTGESTKMTESSGGKTIMAGVRLSLLFVLLFILLLSFTFGPFVHIPTNRGGGRQYSTVALRFAPGSTAADYPFASHASNNDTRVYLLDENSSWVYVTAITSEEHDPRRLFGQIACGKTWCIAKSKVADMVFQKER